MAVTLALALGSVSTAAVAGTPEALGQTPVGPPPAVPAPSVPAPSGSTPSGSTSPGSTVPGSTVPGRPVPQDARDGGNAPQRWAPPLAGTTSGVEVVGGTARLGAARDARTDPAGLRGARRQGFLDLGEHRFGRPVNRFVVPVDADVPPGTAVEVDVRGRGADGRWSEWTTAAPGAPVVLAEPTRDVAVRLVLRGGPSAAAPVVRTLQVVADRVATAPRVIEPRATLRVFATREGLVGGTTANGHVILPNDQFVALPTRRALAPKNSGDYSVRICTDARRCATVPVWDVGPWNTTDDYWNPPAVRQSWKDLPQGRPQAQAAWENQHNGGRDGFGRRVANPAGIDLADGTFYGLGLRTNGWVTVEYLWTGRSTAVGRVISPGVPVPVRPGPSPLGDVGVVGDGAQVDVECQAPGPPVVGTQGTSSWWLRLGPGQFAPAAFVSGAPPVPSCT